MHPARAAADAPSPRARAHAQGAALDGDRVKAYMREHEARAKGEVGDERKRKYNTGSSETNAEEMEAYHRAKHREDDPMAQMAEALTDDEAANLLGSFWDRVLTEFNVAKALSGVEVPLEPQQEHDDGARPCDIQQGPSGDIGEVLSSEPQQEPIDGVRPCDTQQKSTGDLGQALPATGDSAVDQQQPERYE